ncbi:MAG: hypothetical protein LBT80_03330 [Lactobacillaceae bacterium]|jgi:hypothetical protein|nr:hypothetical protein [Lactobacillaceae bacterium]
MMDENNLTKIAQELSVARIPVAWQNYFKWVSDNIHAYALALTAHVAKLSLVLRYPLNITETTVLAILAGQLPIHSQLIVDSRLPSV